MKYLEAQIYKPKNNFYGFEKKNQYATIFDKKL
jgi:hypothetical protein